MSTAPTPLQPIDRIERLEIEVFGSASEHPYPVEGEITFTGATVGGSAAITAIVPSTEGIAAGQLVSGPGVQPDTTILSVLTVDSVSLSSNVVTSSASATFTAAPPTKSAASAQAAKAPKAAPSLPNPGKPAESSGPSGKHS